jgi:hypothetical protein
MPRDLYSTATLVQVVESLFRPQSFLLDTFFTEEVRSDDEEVAVDIEVGNRRLSPLVHPMMQGQVVEGLAYRTATIKPGYVKDKRPIDPTKPVRRAIGERIGGGQMTGEEREAAVINRELQDQLDMLQRRMEFMAVDGLLDGALTMDIKGRGSVSVDFGRAASLTKALLTTARWGEDGVSPKADVEAWAMEVLKESGAQVTDVVFSPEAWDLYTADPKVQRMLDLMRATGGQMDLGSSAKTGAVFKGDDGQFRLWVYNEWYEDEDGNTQRMMPAHSVILGSRQMRGTRAFGMIMDPKAGYMPMQYFPKSWVEDDPPVRFLMLQAAPIVYPARPNACLAATVR